MALTRAQASRAAFRAVERSNALFGFHLEFLAVGGEAVPLPGIIRQEAVLREYFIEIREAAAAAHAAGADRVIRIEPPPELRDRGARWYATLVTQGLDAPRAIALVYQLQNEAEATDRLLSLQATLCGASGANGEPCAPAGRFAWDRLFETCVRHSSSAILIPGVPPYVRISQKYRGLVAPTLTSDHLSRALGELLPNELGATAGEGLYVTTVRYGTARPFEIAVLNPAAPKAAFVVPTGEHARADFAGWDVPSFNHPWFVSLHQEMSRSGSSGIVCEGLPPMVWNAKGIRALDVPPLRHKDSWWLSDYAKKYFGLQRSTSEHVEYAYSANGVLFRWTMWNFPWAPLLVISKEESQAGQG